MTFGRYVLTADVTVPAGVSSYPAAGPATTATGTTTATPASGAPIGSGVALSAGTYLLSWTATLQTAAAAQDANNFSLTAAGLATASVNAGTVGSYPQAAVTYYTGASTTALVKVGGSAGSTGSVYSTSLTVTPLMTGDNKGVVSWAGAGSPAGWAAGGWPVAFKAGTPLWLDAAGVLYAALGGSANLRAWIDGQDNVGHGRWAALSN